MALFVNVWFIFLLTVSFLCVLVGIFKARTQNYGGELLAAVTIIINVFSVVLFVFYLLYFV